MKCLTALHAISAGRGEFISRHRDMAGGLEEWVLFRKYWDSGDTIDSLAAGVGVDRDEMSAFVRDILDERFLTLRKRLRIMDAAELLLTRPEMSVLKVSREVGFPDKSDFRRAFQEEKGMSPVQWRQCMGNRLRFWMIRILESGGSRWPSRYKST